MKTRFSVLPDERRVLIGIDKDNIFEEGVVYGVVKILDQITLKPLGRWAMKDKGYPSKHSTIQAIAYNGLHLVTKEEYSNHSNL